MSVYVEIALEKFKLVRLVVDTLNCFGKTIKDFDA